MYTSYFANLKRVKHPLSICGKAPDWYAGAQFKILAPKYDFFAAYKAGEIDEAGYTEQFNAKVLAPLDPHHIHRLIISQYTDEVSLLCYEKPGEFCHRHLVAAWFKKELGIDVVEHINFDPSPMLEW